MKKKFFDKIVIILIIILAFLMYPWFVKVNDKGQQECSNLLGFKYKC